LSIAAFRHVTSYGQERL